jgi:ubiquinone/menaquinone biosynthesis C-methylase UbiE
MDAKLQRRVQRYGWDKAAEYYEGFWSRQLAPAQSRLLELAALQPGERVLDIACGTGLVTFPAAAAAGANGEIVGTDISEAMIDLVRQLAAQRGVTNVSFDRMDAEDLGALPDVSFDAVLTALGLMYVPDVLQALKEQHRVLKPGGRAVAAVWGQRDRCGWAEIFPIVESKIASDVCPMFFQMGTKNALAQTMEMAGFADVAHERIPSTLRYESEEEAIGAAYLGGPVALAYSRMDAPTRDAAQREYLESISAYRDGAGYNVPGEFVVAISWKR